jgi:hypothetical protein
MVMPASVRALVHANGPNRAELTLFQRSPQDVVYGLADVLPEAMQLFRRLFPGELLRRVGQITHAGTGQGMLADAPGDRFPP